MDIGRESHFPKYPEIPLLVRRPDIFAVKTVIATEKLHGATFRVHFPLGMSSLDDVRFGSNEMEYRPEGHPHGQAFPLMHAVQWFKSRPEVLTRMWDVIKSYGFSDATVFGEACGPGSPAKGIKYTGGQEILFRAFNVMVGTNFLNTYDLFVEVTDKMGLTRVPVVWRGEPSQEAFDALLEKPSAEALRNGIDDPTNLAEGVVVFSDPLFRDAFGDWLMFKHKAGKFAEKVKVSREKKAHVSTPADEFAATFVTPGRLMNAVARLQVRGVVLSKTMADMPVLIAELVADLHKECEPEWVATGAHDKFLPGVVARELRPIYQRMLESGDA
jgi:hypothetical protein